jgi:hypothetical protein
MDTSSALLSLLRDARRMCAARSILSFTSAPAGDDLLQEFRSDRNFPING